MINQYGCEFSIIVIYSVAGYIYVCVYIYTQNATVNTCLT